MNKSLALSFLALVLSAGAAQAQSLTSVAALSDPATSRNTVVLYVGPRAEYDAKHIPGARFAPNDAFTVTGPAPASLVAEFPTAEVLEQKLEALGVSDGQTIVLAYGRGSLPAATRALFTLEAAGLKASVLDGGQAAWEAAGKPLTADVPAAAQGSLSPFKLSPRIVDAAYVQSHLGAANTVVIDARDPPFYSGAQAGFQAQTRGHIKGAKSITYSTLQKADGTMKSPEEIKAAFRAAGVKEGDEVIAYCHVGQQATVIMLGAKLAGVKAVLYDGSYQDWAQKNLPVEGAPPAP